MTQVVGQFLGCGRVFGVKTAGFVGIVLEIVEGEAIDFQIPNELVGPVDYRDGSIAIWKLGDDRSPKRVFP